MIERFDLAKNGCSLFGTLSQKPRRTTTDFVRDFRITRSVAVHQCDLGGDAEIERLINGTPRQPSATKSIDGSCQAFNLGEGGELIECAFDGRCFGRERYDRICRDRPGL